MNGLIADKPLRRAFDPLRTWAATQNRHETPLSRSRADLNTRTSGEDRSWGIYSR